MSEPPVNDLLTVAQAIALLDATPLDPRVIETDLAQAQGLRLAEDLRADRDYPPFDKSLMDGFAVRGADVTGALPVDLQLVGEIAAGQTFSGSIETGQATAIMTGAPIPPGADGVVPVEQTEVIGQRVRILSSVSDPSRFIARRGHDCAQGTIVLPRGTLLGSAQFAVAATIGAARVKVFAPPTASVLSTGDELVPVDQTPTGSQIRNSNNLMLVSLLRRMRCDVRDLGSAIDRPEIIRSALQQGMQSDLLFVTGGMSMGTYDYVPRLLKELGVETKITKLRIKPGKPFVFGVKTFSDGRRCFVFGLPGNPVSGFVCSVRLAARLVRRLLGGPSEIPLRPAMVDSDLPANGPREFYQPCILNGSRAVPLTWKGSADVFTLARADGLIIREENAPALAKGESVNVLEI